MSMPAPKNLGVNPIGVSLFPLPIWNGNRDARRKPLPDKDVPVVPVVPVPFEVKRGIGTVIT